MTAIAPAALATMALWGALHGWAVLRNDVSETLPVLLRLDAFNAAASLLYWSL